MNSWKLVVGAVIRHGLTVLFTWLVARGVVDQQTAGSLPIGEMTAGIVGLFGTLGWSLYQKAVAKWSFLHALTLDPAMNPQLAEWSAEASDGKPKTIPGTIAVLTGGAK